jgi:hypothetical protein
VVDGQQRIASLARVLLGGTPAEEPFALCFDLDQGQLALPPKEPTLAKDPSRWLPMNQVLDSERLMHWMFAHVMKHPGRRDLAIQLGKRIREYEIPAYLVRTDDESILREIFGRINSAGKKLKENEVFDALHGAYQYASPASLDEVARELEGMGFGHIEEDKVLYRLLLAIQGQEDVRRANSEIRLSPEEAAEAYSQTAQAARRAIQFIREEAGIPHYELLPYKQPLVALGKFFHHYPQPSPRSRELLARWVWRGALTSAHRGDTASTQATLWRIGPGLSEAESVTELLEQVQGRSRELPSIARDFKFSAAISKLQVLALYDLQPQDLVSGEPLAPDWLAEQQGNRKGSRIPQIFSASSVKGLGSSVVNRLFHPPGKGLRSRLESTHDLQILASHGITQEGIQALRAGDSIAFLQIRAHFLEEHMRHFFDSHARWEESDRPALAALIVDDDEEAELTEVGEDEYNPYML